MNWIKIDHEKLDEIPLLSLAIIKCEAGQIEFGVFKKCTSRYDDGIFLSFISRSGESYRIRFISHYAIIEEPKKRKYGSVEEFIDATDWIIYFGCKLIYYDFKYALSLGK